MNNNIIYIIKHPITNEIRYVGQTSQGIKRFRQHIIAKDRKQPVSCFIKSLLKQNLNPIFEIVEYVNIKQLDEKEIFYIKKFKNEGCYLLNLTNGGKSIRGFKMPRNIVERISNKNRGKPSKLKGIKFSEKRKKQMSENSKSLLGDKNPFFGKKHTEETKLKMSINKKGKPAHNRKKIICLNNNTIYNSIREAANILGFKRSSISSVLQGKAKSLKGFFFNYIENTNG